MKGFFANLFGKGSEETKPKADVSPLPNREAGHIAADAFKEGDVIGGKYHVHRILGMGGFGVVLLVSERGSNELHALKTFREEFLADAAIRDAFKKEALLWVNLEAHQFILPARWVQMFSGRPFVAMDYVEPDSHGRVSLADYLRAGESIRAERAVEWAIQFCTGMEHACTHGIRCHRDIKPANILVGKDGRIKIADFGLAAVQHRLTDRERLAAELCHEAGIELIVERSKEQEHLHVTRAYDGSFGFSIVQKDGKTVCGTPGYMAPEIFRGETADLRSDIYNFGLVLWQMATGSALPPFVGAARGDIQDFMQRTYENQIAAKLPAFSHPLGGVIHRCLNPEPAQRYSRFAQIQGDLELILRNLTGREGTKPTEDGQTVAFWCNKGLSLFNLSRIEEAVACFDKALAIDPHDAMSWCNKGGALVQMERYEAAMRCLDKAIEINPKLGLAWINKGGALVDLGQREEALTCYDKALALDPCSTTAWNNKGRIFSSVGMHDKAIACFDKVLSVDPRHSAALNNKARILARLERHREAIACYNRAIEIEPRDALLWNNKGACFAAMGRREDEIACYEKALDIDPQHPMAWFNKAGTEDEIGRTEAAIRSYSKFVQFAPPEYSEQVAAVRGRLQYLQPR